jgi:hypothetical protein
MAVTRTIGPGNAMKPYRADQTFLISTYPESTSQTFITGDILQRSTVSGHENAVQEAVTTPNSGIVGLAIDAATGVADSPITCWVAKAGHEFMGVIGPSVALARTMQDLQCGVTYDSTNKIWRVDTANTTQKCVVITDISTDVEPNGIGTVNAQVAFKFLGSVSVPFGS